MLEQENQAPPQRVRHQTRDALAVMAFSATASLSLVTTVLILGWWINS